MVPKPFSLTHIVYDSEDGLFGWIMALMSLSPVFIIVAICSSILVHREVHSIFLLLGQICCVLLNQILKNIFRQPRPDGKLGVQMSYGMPSDHAQFISCFLVYMICWLSMTCSFTKSSTRILFISCLIVLWSCVVYGRHFLGEHTTPQIVVGIFVGSLFGYFWYYVNDRYFRKWLYSAITRHPVFEYFHFKDLSNIHEDVLSLEKCHAEMLKKSKSS